MRRSPLLLILFLVTAAALSSCEERGSGELSFGFLQQPIVGGQLEIGYPAVGVVFKSGMGGGSMCTGTLITSKVVLTAAHCVGFGTPNAFFVGNDLEGYGQVYDLSHFIQHPNYASVVENNAQIDHHDIAVAILQNSAATAPMPYFIQNLSGYQGSTVKFVGFGVTSSSAGNAGTKRSVSSTIGEVWSQGWWNFTNPNNPKNTCQGDSGGPGFMYVNGVETVIGVVSSGDEYCIESGYNTRTDTNATWIAQMIATYDPGATTQVCGNGVCEVGESYQTCPQDCDDPVEPGGFWDPCQSIGDCQNGMVCIEADDGGHCAMFCSNVGSADECPEGAVCMGLQDPQPGQEGVCYMQEAPVCGDGICSGGETEATCPQDCTGGGACGDVTFQGCCDGEVLNWCENDQLMTLDCLGSPSCGWQAADSYYNCGSAGAADPSGSFPKDCGGSTGPVCGDGSCDGGETAATCPADCGTTGSVCGDGACDAGETAATCPADCGSTPSTCDGGITDVGCCEGQSLVFCDSGSLKVQDCSAAAACGWNATAGAYSCGTAGTADPSGLHPYTCSEIAAPVCGDGICDPGESCETCPADCGECPVAGEDVVGDADTLGGFIFDDVLGGGGDGGGCSAARDSERSPWGLLLLLLGMLVGTRLRIRKEDTSS